MAVRSASVEVGSHCAADDAADSAGAAQRRQSGEEAATSAVASAEDVVILVHSSGATRIRAWPLPAPRSTAVDVSAAGARVTLFGPGRPQS